MAAKPFTEEEELNFFKFASIVHDEFPKMLRWTFKTLWDDKIAPLYGQNWDDSPEVRNFFSEIEGGTKKIPTNTSLENWDCTALFQATIFSKTFATIKISPTTVKPSPFHLSLTSPTGNRDETIALAIDQVRLLRNTLCHSPKSSMTKSDFDNYVRLAKDAFTKTGCPKRRIDDIASREAFPTEKVNELKNKIRAVELEIKQSLEEKNEILKKSNTFLQEDVRKNIATLVEKVDKIEVNTSGPDRKTGNREMNKRI